MTLITSFDPWHSNLCKCPKKLTFNPYTGCDHHCIYCYASSYIPNHQQIRTKKSLLSNLKREAAKLNGEILALSNSSDPYPTIEAKLELTRQCLRIIAASDCRLQIITKSDLVTRDIDLIKNMNCTVTLTLTTLKDELAEILEPQAPPPSRRLKAIYNLVSHGIPVAVRIDPIIPTLNDNPAKLISQLAKLGVKHITSSTYKVKPDNWTRLKLALPKTAETIAPLYFGRGEKVGGNLLLPKSIRFKIMKKISELVQTHGLMFGVCREGFNELNSASCDGSWLLPKIKESKICGHA